MPQDNTQQMNAYLIDPSSREITKIELTDGAQQIASLLGAKSVDFDEIDDGGDRLYFDEDCFIKAKPGDARFKVDNLAPVSGAGIICGAESPNGVLQPVRTDLATLNKRLQFI
ncbi:hypothetical protein [Zwartia vadi]|uniref:hypothetical protein n=1 Tax=Zwartia vadi TaxID=3058168 RepID=UPI0025B37895|nr:hypothetical protein [Zwartia vadi]MDN3988547.1 hypothetical protein [Zwartia vadi]